ncbi:hypothetical protein BC833DRAFT_618191 [Globomyces pollinis-pini]|nr:hypothetical protein BC833DRAFT_618191 [Globomyces pollinis-pini]
MLAFDLQLCVYTAIQYIRFIKPLQLWSEIYEKIMIGIMTVTVIAGGVGQKGMRGPEGTCDFIHHPVVLVAINATHLIFEVAILITYMRNFKQIQSNMVRDKIAHQKISFMLQAMNVVLILFAMWIIAWAVMNGIPDQMNLIVVAANIHFTLLIFFIGFPHLVQQTIRSREQSAQNTIQRSTVQRALSPSIPYPASAA